MKPYLIRSTIFNILFFGITGLFCVLYLPLLLLPRQLFVDAVHFWLHVVAFLERHVMGLHYEIRGAKHLPKEGPYLIAAKHQSAYETLKLHLLFDDPAVILKKELLFIPLWGLFLAKAGVIAIDRSTPEKAIQSIEDGAKRVTAEGRAIVIFPQGTRVSTDTTAQDKAYRPGVARMQEQTGLPIIPMALNSGVFWPRNSWLKKPGLVVFEFLEPIQANNSDRKTVMQTLEMRLEESSQKLVSDSEQHLEQRKHKSPLVAVLAVLLLLITGLYSALWFATAKEVRIAYKDFISSASGEERSVLEPDIFGFPGPIQARVAEEYIDTAAGSARITNLHAQSWPIPGSVISFEADKLEIQDKAWSAPLSFENLSADIIVNGPVITVLDSAVNKESFVLNISGTVHTDQRPIPKFELQVAAKGFSDLLTDLVALDIMETRPALITAAALSALADPDGVVRVDLTQRNRKLYAGPIPVVSLPALPPRAPRNQPAPDQ